MIVRIEESVTNVAADDWDRLVGASGSPFLEWEFLAGLEETGCVGPDTGWIPQPITVHDDAGRLIACAPVYLKTHSMGEYVFDHSWADAARRAGIRYYPKVLVAVPFTPVEGGRLLTDPALDDSGAATAREVLAQALLKLCDDANLSSAHVNFCPPDEAEVLENAGFLKRSGYQYRWVNREGWTCWDDWLNALRSKRRKETRRERRGVAEAGVTVRMVTGEEITPELMETMFALYESHLAHFGGGGRRYLSPEFFERMAVRWRHRLALAIARPTNGGDVVAGALHIRKGDGLYGRYWGAFTDVPYLHFECCYYAAIEHCLDYGIRRFEAGAQGDFKRGRGLDAEVTASMHHLAHPGLHSAVGQFLAAEREAVDQTVDVLLAHKALKRDK